MSTNNLIFMEGELVKPSDTFFCMNM
uniref:Uncharacterized protein n=1 Tax=Anguilla anguilla TaxID=7936 RepID=A0A0E9VS29_ANGAN